MKTFLIVFMCVLIFNYSLCIEKRTVRLPPEISSRLFQTVQQCMVETGIPLDIIMQAYAGGYSEDRRFKDFLFCSYKAIGFLRPDGQLNLAKTVKSFRNDPEIVEGLKRCGVETGRNPKEALFNFYKCFQNTVPVKFVI